MFMVSIRAPGLGYKKGVGLRGSELHGPWGLRGLGLRGSRVKTCTMHRTKTTKAAANPNPAIAPAQYPN